MSGGSFDYLFLSDTPAEALRRGHNLRNMVEELERIAPDHPVTAYSKRVLESDAKGIPSAVKDVWHAVEWYRSADWGFDQVAEVLEATKGYSDIHEIGRDVASAYRAGLSDGRRNLLAELADLTPAYADMVRAYTAAQTEQARQEHTQIPKESR